MKKFIHDLKNTGEAGISPTSIFQNVEWKMSE